jgi:class 3 adenylate cyclase
MAPATRYARSGAVSIAYQTLGEGPDLLCVPGWISHVEHVWEEPSLRRFFERLARFSRLIIFDRRGSGLSDRLTDDYTIEDELADLVAVLDAAGSERTAVMTYAGGGGAGALLAARLPERVSALIMYASMARATAAPGYDWTHSLDERRAMVDALAESWGDTSAIETFAPGSVDDQAFGAWFTRMQRLAASPGSVRAIFNSGETMDVRDLLPTIRVPTLVLHRRDDGAIDPRHSRYIAEHIPGARYVQLPGADTFFWLGDADSLLDEVEEFLTGGRTGGELARALRTVMFTDIIAATGHAVELGDRRWSDLLERHDKLVRRELDRFGGHEVKTIGDSFLATFDGPPSQALRCGVAITEAVRECGIEVRIGLHTGECVLLGSDVGGLAVHIAARVVDLAGPSQVLVSGTVRGAVVGAPFQFDYLGWQELKGVPQPWPLYALRTGAGEGAAGRPA